MTTSELATRFRASPLARRLAREAGMDLSSITGSGPHGRIIQADILKQGQSGKAFSPPSPSLENIPLDPPFTVSKNSAIRKIVAGRLSLSKQTVPHFYLTVECKLDALLSMRRQYNALLEEGQKISINDAIVKICGLALTDIPDANVSWDENGMKTFQRADISVAVAIEGGLVTPILRDAGRKTIGMVSGELKNLIGKARAGKLIPEEYQGGTFSVSNLGMYGIKNFQAIVNPPQAAILAVGSGEKRPIINEKTEAIETATLMGLTLSVDHRAIDGAVAASLLGRIKHYVENPLPAFIGCI